MPLLSPPTRDSKIDDEPPIDITHGKEPPLVDAPYNVGSHDPEFSLESMGAALNNLQVSTSTSVLPRRDDCLAHLKLLWAFHVLREDVSYTDGLFNLWDARCKPFPNINAALAKTREKRWALYVARAVERFQDWWIKVLCNLESSKRQECREMVLINPEYSEFTNRGLPLSWSRSMLPPLDVLMVWHAFMLNPRRYLEDCIRFGLKDLWSSGMPWSAVDASIDIKFNYQVPEEAVTNFISKTGYRWDNAQDSGEKILPCPRCFQELSIPWTTFCQGKKMSISETEEIKGTGYGDEGFSYRCLKCSGLINHETLRVSRLKEDVENLVTKDWPLRGTILSPQTGVAETLEQDLAQNCKTFPNRLMGTGIGSDIRQLLDLAHTTSPTMNDVKELIGRCMKNNNTRKVNSKSCFVVTACRREERLAVHKMVSSYLEDSSIFALGLMGAVIRQGAFVEKMHSIDWLHSPAAFQTMERLILKYTRFIHIIATHPLYTAVPTLDIDLGWHTHQLSPKSYYQYTMSICKKFIDHDDKIGEDVLSSAFEWTSKTYEKLFHEFYSECTCWHCEAIRTKYVSRGLFSMSHETVPNIVHDPAIQHQLTRNSSNNAMQSKHTTTQVAVALHMRRCQQIERELVYERACKRANARGQTVPPREEYRQGACCGGGCGGRGNCYESDECRGGALPAVAGCSGWGGCGGPGGCGGGNCGALATAPTNCGDYGGCGGPGGCGGGNCGALPAGAGCGGGRPD